MQFELEDYAAASLDAFFSGLVGEGARGVGALGAAAGASFAGRKGLCERSGQRGFGAKNPSRLPRVLLVFSPRRRLSDAVLSTDVMSWLGWQTVWLELRKEQDAKQSKMS